MSRPDLSNGGGLPAHARARGSDEAHGHAGDKKEERRRRASMSAIRSLLNGILVAALGLAWASAASGQVSRAAVSLDRFYFFCPNAITQSFPTTGVAQTTWLICWHEVAGYNSIANPNGLVIGPIYFRKAPGAPFVRVLWDMRVSDYFVPYHPGSPRYYDLSAFNFQLTSVTSADCPACQGGGPISPHVCKEVRDRGLMWKDYGGVRRGEELILWGAIDADNYRYIQEYTFRDDGVVIGRMGATGQNLPGDELEPHAHNAIWRINFDFG